MGEENGSNWQLFGIQQADITVIEKNQMWFMDVQPVPFLQIVGRGAKKIAMRPNDSGETYLSFCAHLVDLTC